MSCERCPCPDICLGHPVWCQWAAADPPDPVHLRHIYAVSSQALKPVDTLMAEVRRDLDAGAIPERVEPRGGCCNG